MTGLPTTRPSGRTRPAPWLRPGELAWRSGEPHGLVLETLTACRAQQDEIANHASHETLLHVLANVIWLRMRTISDVRAMSKPVRCDAAQVVACHPRQLGRRP